MVIKQSLDIKEKAGNFTSLLFVIYKGQTRTFHQKMKSSDSLLLCSHPDFEP